MLKSFAIPTNLRGHQEFCEFVGVNFGLMLHVLATYTLPRTPSVAESRAERERVRAATVRYAVPVTRDTQGRIESAAPPGSRVPSPGADVTATDA